MGGMFKVPKPDPAALLQQQQALEAQQRAVEEQRQVLAEQQAEQQTQRDRAAAGRRARMANGGISLLAMNEVGVERTAPVQQKLGA